MSQLSGFDAIGVSPDLSAALAEQGINEPFPIQELTIPDGLAGRDVCGKAKTGSGKTLAFGLPMIENTKPAAPHLPRGLVLVPTLSGITAFAGPGGVPPHAPDACRPQKTHLGYTYRGGPGTWEWIPPEDVDQDFSALRRIITSVRRC